MKLILQSIRQLILWTVITGVVYPLVMTVAFQALFPKQAAGSLGVCVREAGDVPRRDRDQGRDGPQPPGKRAPGRQRACWIPA